MKTLRLRIIGRNKTICHENGDWTMEVTHPYPQPIKCQVGDCIQGGFEIGKKMSQIIKNDKGKLNNRIKCKGTLGESKSENPDARRCLANIEIEIIGD